MKAAQEACLLIWENLLAAAAVPAIVQTAPAADREVHRAAARVQVLAAALLREVRVPALLAVRQAAVPALLAARQAAVLVLAAQRERQNQVRLAAALLGHMQERRPAAIRWMKHQKQQTGQLTHSCF